MGTDFSIRPVGVPVALPVVRQTSDALSSAVQTELPAPQAASQPDSTDSTTYNSQPPASQLSHNVVIDSAANSIVYQTVNQDTGQVINQFPDDVVLQARAYYRALEEVQYQRSLYDQSA